MENIKIMMLRKILNFWKLIYLKFIINQKNTIQNFLIILEHELIELLKE